MSKVLTRAEIDEALAKLKPEDIVARECKHATYATHRGGEPSDALIIKEYVILKDGTRLPRLRLVENYKRPYWVTKPHFRNHPDKIQFEDLDRVDMFKSTQINLRRDICFRLNGGNPSNPLRMLARSPYLYGLDPGPEVFMKQSYMDKWPGTFKPNHVTVIDAETDVYKDGFSPILWSLVSDDEIVLYVEADWAVEIPNYAEQIHKLYSENLEQWLTPIREKLADKKTKKYPEFLDYVKTIPLRVEIIKDPYFITKAMVDRLHETQPDIVTGWNVFFDAKVIEGACLAYGADPADMFSDPRVPYDYRGVYLKEGAAVKKTDSDREMRLDPQERWNIILNTASWRMQDAMQTYWQLRKAKGKESGGYGLDAILTRQLGVGKLKFEVADSTVPGGTLHWHMDMQRNYKVPYGLYNIFDSIGVWVLDKKNNDLSSQISALAGSTDYSRFNSQPTINSNDMLFTALANRRKVICSTSDDMMTEHDKMTIGKEGVIVTFPSHNVADTGQFIYEDMPEVRSTIHLYNADADVETTYPIAQIIQNLSEGTTMNEPCKIQGVSRELQILTSINMTGGRVNALETMQTVCKMKNLDEWLEQARVSMA